MTVSLITQAYYYAVWQFRLYASIQKKLEAEMSMYFCTCVLSNFTHNDQKVGILQVTVDGQMDKKIIHIHANANHSALRRNEILEQAAM